MTYATVQDVEDRWRTLTSEERELAGTLLEDCEIVLEKFSHASAGALKVVSCAMVKRALMAHGDAFALSQPEEMEAWHASYPAGELKPMKHEIDLLRSSSGNIYASSVPMACL